MRSWSEVNLKSVLKSWTSLPTHLRIRNVSLHLTHAIAWKGVQLHEKACAAAWFGACTEATWPHDGSLQSRQRLLVWTLTLIWFYFMKHAHRQHLWMQPLQSPLLLHQQTSFYTRIGTNVRFHNRRSASSAGYSPTYHSKAFGKSDTSHLSWDHIHSPQQAVVGERLVTRRDWLAPPWLRSHLKPEPDMAQWHGGHCKSWFRLHFLRVEWHSEKTLRVHNRSCEASAC